MRYLENPLIKRKVSATAGCRNRKNSVRVIFIKDYTGCVVRTRMISDGIEAVCPGMNK